MTEPQHERIDLSQIPSVDRPLDDPHPMNDLGRRYPVRYAKSGARWCATCNTMLKTEARDVFCTACVRYRNAERGRRRRAADAGKITVPVETIASITSALARHDESLYAFLDARRSGEKNLRKLVDEVAATSKALAHEIRSGLVSQ